MNWQIFKSFYELYKTGRTKIKNSLVEDPTFKYHVDSTKELLITKREIIVRNETSFAQAFESHYLNKYYECLSLLNEIGENLPQCRFNVNDILALKEMKRQMDIGKLAEIRNQIILSNETRRGVSLMFFKNEKHLDSSTALERAVKGILDIDEFADSRDFQYLYVLQCHSPKLIILCENLHFLKMPDKARRNYIELWYAGGKNIEKLAHTPSRSIPVYYLCDWDYDGLLIYEAVKSKMPSINLLTPNGLRKKIVESEHKSLWKQTDSPSFISGLNSNLYSESQKQLIETLIIENSWIIEESNDLLKLSEELSIT